MSLPLTLAPRGDRLTPLIIVEEQCPSTWIRPTEASVRANAPQEAQARKPFGEETEEDRLKALADAEKKNLWDATEVIDMDTF